MFINTINIFSIIIINYDIELFILNQINNFTLFNNININLSFIKGLFSFQKINILNIYNSIYY